MKRKAIAIGIATSVALIGMLAFLCFGRVGLRGVIKAEVVSEEDRSALSFADREWIAELLDGKRMGERNLACGVSDAYLVLTLENGDTATFYSAFDSCPYVYYAERDRYVRLSPEESDAFRALLSGE